MEGVQISLNECTKIFTQIKIFPDMVALKLNNNENSNDNSYLHCYLMTEV